MPNWLPNLVTLVRLPTALLFLASNPLIRCFALLAGAASDFLDGFLARRFALKSRLGTWLDPLLDKFFVGFILGVLYFEEKASLGLILSMLSRDFAVGLFALKLFFTKKWQSYRVEAFFWGKIATTLQFAVLGALIFSITIPFWIPFCFLIIGFFSFIELTYRN